MCPLVQIGPFRLSTGGLMLLISLIVGGSLVSRIARVRGGAKLARQADNCFYPVLIGAVLGGRLWYGLFNLDLYARNPGLFVALRVSDFAWPGALLGGALVGYLWCRWNRFDELALADSAVLRLPVTQALASVGLLFSGEASGLPTSLPWGMSLFGTTRHPTQIYFALAALLILGALTWLARRELPAGALAAAYLALNGLALLLIEALRADSLVLPGGIRVAQVFGLTLVLYAVYWVRRHATTGGLPALAETAPAPERQGQP